MFRMLVGNALDLQRGIDLPLGWVSDDDIFEVARRLGLNLARVKSFEEERQSRVSHPHNTSLATVDSLQSLATSALAHCSSFRHYLSARESIRQTCQMGEVQIVRGAVPTDHARVDAGV